MEISSINFSQSVLPKSNKISNNASNIAFKGNDNERNVPSHEQCTFFFHPVFELQKQLLEDGYSLEEIRKHEIFDVIEVNNSNLFNPDILDDIYEGKITKKDVISHHPKKLADIQAIQRAYVLLKQKFNTPDVQKHIAKVNAMEEELSRYFKAKGEEMTYRTTCQGMILDVLHYVDKNNVALVEELLNDKNFNNVHLSAALMKLDKNKDMRYAHQALHLAQEVGYSKDFSQALAILISEAEPFNIKIIEKMLSEQDFLSQNDDFVCNNLMSFLRGWKLELLCAYMSNDTMTLNDINELMNLENDMDDED